MHYSEVCWNLNSPRRGYAATSTGLLRPLDDLKNAVFFIGQILRTLRQISDFKAHTCITCHCTTVILLKTYYECDTFWRMRSVVDLKLWRSPYQRDQTLAMRENGVGMQHVRDAAITRDWCDQWHRHPLSVKCINKGCPKIKDEFSR
jgi:hypothetical protein